MIEVHKYIADDGTEFANEDDCLDYERGLNVSKYNNQIIALDFLGKREPLHNTGNHVYLYIANKDAYDFYNDLCYEDNCIQLDTVSKSGFFYFDDSCDEWMNLDDWISQLMDYKRTIENVLDAIIAEGGEIEGE